MKNSASDVFPVVRRVIHHQVRHPQLEEELDYVVITATPEKNPSLRSWLARRSLTVEKTKLEAAHQQVNHKGEVIDEFNKPTRTKLTSGIKRKVVPEKDKVNQKHKPVAATPTTTTTTTTTTTSLVKSPFDVPGIDHASVVTAGTTGSVAATTTTATAAASVPPSDRLNAFHRMEMNMRSIETFVYQDADSRADTLRESIRHITELEKQPLLCREDIQHQDNIQILKAELQERLRLICRPPGGVTIEEKLCKWTHIISAHLTLTFGLG